MTMRNDDEKQDRPEIFEEPGADGRRLWQDFRAANAADGPTDGPADGTVDEADEANHLSAYLDGRLSGDALEAFEARLAASPALLDACLAADGALGASEPAPDRLLRRAAALVPGEAMAPAAREGFWSRLFGGSTAGTAGLGGLALETGGERGGLLLRPMTLAATLAAILVISVAGFELGRFGYAVAAETYFPESDSFSVASQAGL